MSIEDKIDTYILNESDDDINKKLKYLKYTLELIEKQMTGVLTSSQFKTLSKLINEFYEQHNFIENEFLDNEDSISIIDKKIFSILGSCRKKFSKLESKWDDLNPFNYWR